MSIFKCVSGQKCLLIEKNNFAANQIYRIMYSSENLERFLLSVPDRGLASWRISVSTQFWAMN